MPTIKAQDVVAISHCYATQGFPVKLNDGADLKTNEHFMQNPPGIVVPDGSSAKLVDFPPGYESPIHRSMSLSYNFVIEGIVEVVLDSGEVKTLAAGDSIVQRAVNHSWRNLSSDAPARICAISLPVVPFEIVAKKAAV